MDHEELRCLAMQLKQEIEQDGRASATILYNDETTQAEIMATLERLVGKEHLQRADLKLVYNEGTEA